MSRPPSLAQFQKAVKADDAEKLRDYLRRIILQGSSGGGAAAATTTATTATADKLLRGVAKEMTKTQDLIDTLVNVLWFESHYRCHEGDSNKKMVEKDQLAEAAAERSSVGGVVRLLKVLCEDHRDNVMLRDGLLESVGASLLEESGWIVEKDLTKRIRLFNTQLYYKQHKYNLLAEESQGYAKYLELLIGTAAAATAGTDNTNNKLLSDEIRQEQVRTLIGNFALDPNRCLDIAVDVMIQTHQQQAAKTLRPGSIVAAAPSSGGSNNNTDDNEARYDNFLPLLRALPLDHLPELLALALQRKHDGKPWSTNVPKLLSIMSWMVRRGLLDVDDMLDYLLTSETETLLTEAYKATVQAQKERIRDMARVRLSGGGDASSGASATAAKALSLQKNLSETKFLRWTMDLLQNKQLSHSSAVLPHLTFAQWSQLCVLFPARVGVALCDIVLGTVAEAEEDAGTRNAPWNETAPTPTPSQQLLLHAMDVDQEGDPAHTITLEDLVSKIDKILEYTRESGCIALRPVLYVRLCRLFAHHLRRKKEQEEATAPSVLNFFKKFMLPSLSLFPSNPALVQDVWSFLRLLPYQTRYDFYHYWRGSGLERAAICTDKPLWLVQGELQAGKDSRYALKRLSKDTIRDMSRAIAKVCHSHPLVVFTTILNQIESYDNLVQVMVDALRFVTPLSLDVLSSCILSRLSGDAASAMMVNRSRLKDDGVNVSQWLQSLEAFIGAFYKRYPNIDFRGILRYLIHRLEDGHVMELGILRTLLKTSCGWAFQDYSPAASLSTAQLEGRAGSSLLARETMSFGVVEVIDWRASNELRRVLQADDMGISLLILLSQVRHQIVFSSQRAAATPVKLVANLIDNCQVTMSMLLDFLTNPAEPGRHANDYQASSVYAKSLPPMQDLFSVYQLDVASSWMLCRPLIRAAASNRLESGKAAEDEEMAEAAADPLKGFRPTEESHKLYKEMLPGPTWSFITTELFELFYANSLYDIFCPEDLYASQISRLDKLSVQRSTTPPPSAMPPGPGAPPSRNEGEEQNRLKRVITRLKDDFAKQKKHVASIRKLISSKKEELFASDKVSREAAGVFLSRCLYRRCMQGPDDALYCAQFISILHEEQTPGFGTLQLFDSIIAAMSRALFGLTEGEAANVSILLHAIWKTVSKWRYDEIAYEEEVSGKPGSFMVKAPGDEPAPVSYTDYEDLYNKWHAALGAAAVGSLKSPEYIHKRNCLIVLTRMVDVFPTRPGLANRLLKTLEPLQDESNSLADIRASAQAYATQLLRARDDGVWKEESAETVLARQKREQATAAARQKQAQKNMEEIKLESEKITDQLGGDGRRDRDRRRPPPPLAEGRDLAPRRGGPPLERPPDRRPPPPPPAQPSHDDRRGGPPSNRDPPRDERRARDRAPTVAPPASGTSSYSAMGASSGGAAARNAPASGRGLDDRWQPQSRGGAGSKRSRTSSPAEEGEATREDQRPAKRARPEPEPPRYEEGRDGGGGGGRPRRSRGGGRRS